MDWVPDDPSPHLHFCIIVVFLDIDEVSGDEPGDNDVGVKPGDSDVGVKPGDSDVGVKPGGPGPGSGLGSGPGSGLRFRCTF